MQAIQPLRSVPLPVVARYQRPLHERSANCPSNYDNVYAKAQGFSLGEVHPFLPRSPKGLHKLSKARPLIDHL